MILKDFQNLMNYNLLLLQMNDCFIKIIGKKDWFLKQEIHLDEDIAI